MSVCAFCFQLPVTEPPAEEEEGPEETGEAAEAVEAGDTGEGNLSHIERAAMEEATAGRPQGQSRGQKRARHDDDEREVMRDIRDAMHLNTDLLSKLVATKSSSGRDPFINYVADTLRSMNEADYKEAQKRIHRLFHDIEEGHAAPADLPAMLSTTSPGPSRGPSTSHQYQPPPDQWTRVAPAAQGGVWGSASQEYMEQYHSAPYLPGYQAQPQPFQQPQQRHFHQPPQPRAQQPPQQQTQQAQQQQTQQPQQQPTQQPQQQQTQQTPQQPSRRESEGAASSLLGSGLDLSAMNFSLPSDGLPDLSLASNLSLNTPPLPRAQARVPEKDNSSKDKQPEKDKDQ